MTPTPWRPASAVALLAFAVGAPAEAPGQLVTAVGAGWYVLDVGLLPEINSGPGIDGVVRFDLTGWLQVGAGLQFNAHTVGESSESYEVMVPFLEPRFLIGSESARWTPFLAPRIGWMRHSFRFLGQDATGSGRLLGGLGGMGLRVSPTLSILASVIYYRATVRRLDLGDVQVTFNDLSADAYGFRAAVEWTPGR